MKSELSLLIFSALLYTLFHLFPGVVSADQTTPYFILLVLLSWSHFSYSFILSYQRRHHIKHPVFRMLVVPLCLFLCLFFTLYFYKAPFFLGHVALFLVAWHYAMQCFGIGLILAERKKVKLDHASRRGLKLLSYLLCLCFFGSFLNAEVHKTIFRIPYQSISIDFPFWSLGVAALVLFSLTEYLKHKNILHLLPLFTLTIWFIPTSHPSWFLVLPLLHGAQYFTTVRGAKILNKSFLYGVATVIAVAFAESYVPLFRYTLPDSWLFPALVASVVTVNWQHYLMDRVYWKRSMRQSDA